MSSMAEYLLGRFFFFLTSCETQDSKANFLFVAINMGLQVSRNTLATYVFAIARLPGHLESKFWTFSWSPFNYHFKTVLILIPIIKIGQTITLRRKK